MRISDWSPDVCSSDLIVVAGRAVVAGRVGGLRHGIAAEGRGIAGHVVGAAAGDQLIAASNAVEPGLVGRGGLGCRAAGQGVAGHVVVAVAAPADVRARRRAPAPRPGRTDVVEGTRRYRSEITGCRPASEK